MNKGLAFLCMLVGLAFCLPVPGCGIVELVKGIEWTRNVEGHIKRAADANSIDLAKQELGTALNYLESNDITSGTTSVIYEIPHNDVGFWYKNLKVSLKQIEDLPKDTKQSEQDMVLIKLRQTLLDHTGEHAKERVTQPDTICLFPHNTAWVVGRWVIAFICIIGVFLIIAGVAGISGEL